MQGLGSKSCAGVLCGSLVRGSCAQPLLGPLSHYVLPWKTRLVRNGLTRPQARLLFDETGGLHRNFVSLEVRFGLCWEHWVEEASKEVPNCAIAAFFLYFPSSVYSVYTVGLLAVTQGNQCVRCVVRSCAGLHGTNTPKLVPREQASRVRTKGHAECRIQGLVRSLGSTKASLGTKRLGSTKTLAQDFCVEKALCGSWFRVESLHLVLVKPCAVFCFGCFFFS